MFSAKGLQIFANTVTLKTVKSNNLRRICVGKYSPDQKNDIYYYDCHRNGDSQFWPSDLVLIVIGIIAFLIVLLTCIFSAKKCNSSEKTDCSLVEYGVEIPMHEPHRNVENKLNNVKPKIREELIRNNIYVPMFPSHSSLDPPTKNDENLYEQIF